MLSREELGQIVYQGVVEHFSNIDLNERPLMSWKFVPTKTQEQYIAIGEAVQAAVLASVGLKVPTTVQEAVIELADRVEAGDIGLVKERR